MIECSSIRSSHLKEAGVNPSMSAGFIFVFLYEGGLSELVNWDLGKLSSLLTILSAVLLLPSAVAWLRTIRCW